MDAVQVLLTEGVEEAFDRRWNNRTARLGLGARNEPGAWSPRPRATTSWRKADTCMAKPVRVSHRLRRSASGLDEEAERFRVVVVEDVLDLLVVVQGLLVGLAAIAGLLVAAEAGAGWVLVIGVDPDPSGLDVLTGFVGDVGVTAPDAGPESVDRVVRDRDCFAIVLERCDGHHRAEDLLLEHPHVVGALEDGRLDEVAAGELAW